MPMTINKIIQRVASEKHMTKSEASRVIKTSLKIMKQKLENGEDISIDSFGEFIIKERKPRRIYNIHTKKEFMIDAKRVVTFKCSKLLKRLINIDYYLNDPKFIGNKKMHAYHEAGHAVICYYYFWDMISISIKPTIESYGRVSRRDHFNMNIQLYDSIKSSGNPKLQALFPKVPDYLFEQHLDISLAGEAASIKKFPGESDGLSGNDYTSAIETATKWAQYHNDNETLEFLKQCDTDFEDEDEDEDEDFQAKKFYQKYSEHVTNLMQRDYIWECIECLATELLKKETLYADELYDFIDKIWEEIGANDQHAVFVKEYMDKGEREWGSNLYFVNKSINEKSI